MQMDLLPLGCYLFTPHIKQVPLHKMSPLGFEFSLAVTQTTQARPWLGFPP
jgi:hypothetical protein